MIGLTNHIMSILIFDEFNHPFRIIATFNLRRKKKPFPVGLGQGDISPPLNV